MPKSIDKYTNERKDILQKKINEIESIIMKFIIVILKEIKIEINDSFKFFASNETNIVVDKKFRICFQLFIREWL